MSFYVTYVKRLLDLILSIIALPFFLVILLFVSIAIKIDDGGPIFYLAKRVGKDGKLFTMYKFRSMKLNAPDIRTEDGSTFNASDDPRVTRVGRVLRESSLDETAQIINLFIGNMSIVGPRPNDLRELDYLEGEDFRKQDLLPGITGYSQAYYRNSITFKERIKNDIYYVDHVSFCLDVKIFFKTIQTVLLHRGIYISEDSKKGTK
ncbi:MAG: sugar transferase [Coriobacteriia bacterium]|nr:sugar transferase [Coriobacteriia bacterium]